MATLDTDDLQQIGDIVATKILDYFTANPISNSFTTIDTNVNTILADTTSLKTTIATINTNVNTVKTSTTTTKNDVTLIKPMIVDYFDSSSGSSVIDDNHTSLYDLVDNYGLMIEKYFNINSALYPTDKTLFDVTFDNLSNLLSSKSSQVLSDIGTSQSNILTAVNNAHNVTVDLSSADLTPISNAVTSILSQNVSNVIADASLNGYGSEYKDGDFVTVTGRDVVYAVSRSFFTIYSENAYTIHYAISSQDGQRLVVPEALLERYVAPVTPAP